LKKNNIEQVLNGESEYGVADSVLFLYQEQKQPVVIVAPIFQHSPSVLITLASSDIDSPYQLEGKNITFYQKDTDGFGILAMLQSLGVKPILERNKETTDYTHLMSKKTDAYASYLTNEAYSLQLKGMAINIIDPANYGFDLYGDMLFTTTDEAQNNPQRVQKFKDATIKGWKYALEHKEELIEIIKTKYAPQKSIDHLRYEADAIEDVVRHKSIEIGTLDRGRIRYTFETYKMLGLVKDTIDIEKYIFKPFQTKINLTKEEKEWLQANPNIQFSSIVHQKPLIFLDENAEPAGIMADYFKLISRIVAQEMKLNPVLDDEKYHESGKYTGNYGLASVLDIESNHETYNFTKPYMYSNFIFFTNKSDQIKYKNLEDFSHKKIAILKNHKGMEDYLSKLKDVEIVYAQSVVEQMEMLQHAEVDAILGYQTYNFMINEYFFSDIVVAFNDTHEFSISIGLNKEHTLLKSILNKAIDTITVQERQKIISKWIQNTSSSIHDGEDKKDFAAMFTQEEREYLQNKKNIRMCIDPDWMPFEKNDNGKHIGMSADYMNILEKEIGLPIKMVPTNSWMESLEFGKQRKCDILSLIMQTKKREEYLVFTKPYLEVPTVIVTSIDELFVSDFSQIKDKKVAIIKGYAYGEIIQEKYPNMQMVEVENLQEGLDGINKGEFFGLVETLATAGYQIQKEYIGQLKIAGKFDEKFMLGIGVRNDEPILKDIFEKAIEQIPAEKRQEILNKWISVNYDKEGNYKTIMRWSFVMALVFVVILLIVLRVNRILNKEIQSRKAIEKKLQEISVTDALTNLYNRRYFNEIFPTFLNLSKRKNEKVCFAIMDIDYFKLYNDNYGHLSGDNALKSVAACMKTSLLRADDYCFRLGGEEFGILFREESSQKAKDLIEKIRQNIENLRIEHNNNAASKYLSASFGIVIHDAQGVAVCEDLYKEADELLYKAKEAGRNCVYVNQEV
jgi:diguanylate cyclase (GGDEF)-like protein